MVELINWLNKNHNTNLKPTSGTESNVFVYLWNIFEREQFSKNFSVGKIDEWLNKHQIDFNSFEAQYKYFENRYIHDLKGDYFELFPDKKNDRDGVLRILENEGSTDREKLYALMVIVFRFKNNFIHGNKTIKELPNQEENFSQVNKALFKFLGQ